MLQLRRATADDAAEVADLYLASFRAALPTVRLAHPDDDVHRYIREIAIGRQETWVAVDGAAIVGMLVLGLGWVEQLYVAPDRLGEGIGRALLELAIQRETGLGEPTLDLWTFQVNARARRFYERNGFVAVEITDGSGNEEREPDVRYRRVLDSDPAGPRAPGTPGTSQAK